MSTPRNPLVEVVRRVRSPAFGCLIAAHRGDSRAAPENTLAAFESAIAAGSDLIELDVHLTADGEVVVFHDGKLDRTTSGTGEIRTRTLAELRELDAGAWFDPRFAGEKIPTLDEMLDLVRGRVVPMIEVKGRQSKTPEMAGIIIKALEDRDMLGEAIIFVREKGRAKEFHELAPELPVGLVAFTGFQARSLIKLPYVMGVDQYWKSLSPKLVREIHEASCFVTPWTVNSADDMRRCVALGVECLITDSPTLMRDVLEDLEVRRVADEEPELDLESDEVLEEHEALTDEQAEADL